MHRAMQQVAHEVADQVADDAAADRAEPAEVKRGVRAEHRRDHRRADRVERAGAEEEDEALRQPPAHLRELTRREDPLEEQRYDEGDGDQDSDDCFHAQEA